MPRKTCLTQIIFLILILAVAILALRRCGAPPAAVTGKPAARPLLSWLLPSRARSSSLAPTPTRDPARTGIEGLGLPALRPLLFDIAPVRGLEVTERYLWIASYDDAHHAGMLYQVDRQSYTVIQSRMLEQGGLYRLAGVQQGPELLWTALIPASAEQRAVLIGMRPGDLSIAARVPVTDTLRAVAQGDDGTLYGVSSDGRTLYAWGLDGALLRQATASPDVRYQDMDVVRGSLVCAGQISPDLGALDVLDPASLNLLVRHAAYALSPKGVLVTGRAFGYGDGAFHFLPDDGSMPMVMSYTLGEPALAGFVPSVGSR